jgi:hypothetical protein
VPVQVISLFNEFELEQILCGLGEINVDDWRKHAVMIGTPSSVAFLLSAPSPLSMLTFLSFLFSFVSLLGSPSGYRRDEDKVQEDWFWEILTEDFNNTQRGQVLQFVTGSAQVLHTTPPPPTLAPTHHPFRHLTRPPSRQQVPVSFQYLHPRFTVALVRGLKKDSFPYGHTWYQTVPGHLLFPFKPNFALEHPQGVADDGGLSLSLCFSFNRVDFPVYSSKEKMRAGLLKALDLGLVGFALR